MSELISRKKYFLVAFILIIFIIMGNAINTFAEGDVSTMTAIDGTIVTPESPSSTKLNIFVFGRPTCMNTQGTLKNITESDFIDDKNIAFYYGDVDGNDISTVTDFSKNYSSKIKFCYGNNFSLVKKLSGINGGTLPFVIYIDENGKVIGSTTGYQTKDEIYSWVCKTLGYEKENKDFDIQVLGSVNAEEARSMLAKVNSFRKGSEAWYWNADNSTKTVCSNLNDLTYDYELEKVAILRAKEIAFYFDHYRPTGYKYLTAFPDGYSAYGENIMCGTRLSMEDGFLIWKEDDKNYSGQGHRRNMLSSSFNAIGIACFEAFGNKYWVQEFGYKSSFESNNLTPVSYSDKAQRYSITVSKDSCSNYELSYGNYNISINETKQLDLTLKLVSYIYPEEEFYLPTTATVENPDIVKLSDDWKATGLKVGSTVIKLTSKPGKNVTFAADSKIEVEAISIDKASIQIPEDSYYYTGYDIEPKVTVKLNGKTLTENKDFGVNYENNINVGKAKITVWGIGNYCDVRTISFSIKNNKTSDGSTISEDGKKITDQNGTQYQITDTVKTIKKNMLVADKKTSGKYRVTKIVKKNGVIKSGEVEYIAPYNKKCKTATIPAQIKIAGKYYKVTSVGKECFKGCKNITKVVIGTNVTTIGTKAFYGCTKLKTIKISTTKIKKIGANSFKNIYKTATVKVPKSKLAKYTKLIKKANAPKKSKITK